ncbi:13671_t:CDS:1, partial [Dentiscutata heterogama]
EFGQYMLAASINEKIDQYKHIINDDITVASILDLQTKLLLFEIGQETTDAVNKVREVFNQYHTTLTDKQAYNLYINKDDISTTRNYFKGLKRCCLESGYKTNRTSANELE